MKALNVASGLVISGLVLVLLIVGKELFIPFFIALLIWFLITSIAEFLEEIDFGPLKLPYWVRTIIAFVLVFVVLYFIGNLVAGKCRKYDGGYASI